MFSVKEFMNGLYFSTQDILEVYLNKCENKKEIEEIVMQKLRKYFDIAECEIEDAISELREIK